MATNHTFRHWSPALKENLDTIHSLIRDNKHDEAINLYGSIARDTQGARDAIKREAEFLSLIDQSNSFGTEASQHGVTPRQALIYAAVIGWRGDEPSTWDSPVKRQDLVAWAQSHYGGPAEHIEAAFPALEAQGLFFEVHPRVFDPPVYYCTYDPEFLDEIPEGHGIKEYWEAIREENEEEHRLTWLKTGLCTGQGSQGPSGVPAGPCLGTCCSWFENGNEHCNWELRFNNDLLGYRPSSR